MLTKKIFAGIILVLFFVSFSYAQKAPANLRAAIIVKILAFEKGYKPNGSIFVIGDNDLASQLQASGKFSKVETGSSPSGSFNAVYCDDAGAVGAVTSYTRSKKVPSLTGVLGLVEKGITVGVGIDGGKPKILMNLSSSQAEGLDWNPAIFNIVTKI
jgi:hypothetical protein